MDTMLSRVHARIARAGFIASVLLVATAVPLGAQKAKDARDPVARSARNSAAGDSTAKEASVSARSSTAKPWAQFDKYFSVGPAGPAPRAADSVSHATAPAAAPVVASPAAGTLPPERNPGAAPAAPTAPQAARSAATTPSTAASASPAAPVPPVAVGFGSIKLTGGIQAWYINGSGAADNTFRLRRAELRLMGQINPRVSWLFDFDAAKALASNNTYAVINGQRVMADQSVNQSSRMLQDAHVTIAPRRTLQVDIGQFKIPFTNEGSNSPWKIETVEQPMFISDKARGGGWSMLRDVGVMVRGTTLKRVDYFVGAFNGSGDSQNATDRDVQKAVIGRVVVRAFVPGLQFGASGVLGGAPTADRPRRDRAAAEVQFTTRTLTLRSEFISGTDANLRRAGYYLHTGYKVRPGFEAIARFDVWDPDVHAESTPAVATAREALVGFNHYLAGNYAKVQLNVVRRAYANNLLPTLTQLLVNVQAAW
jgi:hypothetical protein